MTRHTHSPNSSPPNSLDSVPRIALMQSPRRADTLESYARLHAVQGAQIDPEQVKVSVVPQLDTARVAFLTTQPGQDQYLIQIPAVERDYYESLPLSPKAADRIIQYAETLHEAGHILFTDEQAVKTQRRQATAPSDPDSRYNDFYAILEDGAIEHLLRRKLTDKATHRLAFKNKQKIGGQLTHRHSQSSSSNSNLVDLPESGTVPLTAQFATTCALMDLAKFCTGDLHAILSSTVTDQSQLPDGISSPPQTLNPDRASEYTGPLTDADDLEFITSEHKTAFFEAFDLCYTLVEQVKSTSDANLRATLIWDGIDKLYDILHPLSSPDTQSQSGPQTDHPVHNQQPNHTNNSYGPPQASPPSQSQSQSQSQSSVSAQTTAAISPSSLGQSTSQSDGQSDDQSGDQSDGHSDDQSDGHSDDQSDGHSDDTTSQTGTRTTSQTGTRTTNRTGNRTASQTGNRTDNQTGSQATSQTGTRTDNQTGTQTTSREPSHSPQVSQRINRPISRKRNHSHNPQIRQTTKRFLSRNHSLVFSHSPQTNQMTRRPVSLRHNRSHLANRTLLLSRSQAASHTPKPNKGLQTNQTVTHSQKLSRTPQTSQAISRKTNHRANLAFSHSRSRLLNPNRTLSQNTLGRRS